MKLDLLVPIKIVQDLIKKYWKVFVGVTGMVLVFGAFVIGYRFGSSIGLERIIFSSTNAAQVGFVPSSSWTSHEESEGEQNHKSDADWNTDAEEENTVEGTDLSSIISELTQSGFNEKIRMPTNSPVVVPHGWRKDSMTEDWRYSSGIRFASSDNDIVCAAMSGVVVSIEQKVSGYEVALLHPFDITTHYWNLKSVLVAEGERVDQGESLGYSGDSSKASGGLYFEVRQFGESVDPEGIGE